MTSVDATPAPTAARPRALRPARMLTRWHAVPESRRYWILMTAIIAIGLGIRLAFVIVRQWDVQLGSGDAFWYHAQGRLVAEGKGWLEPFQWYREGMTVQGADHPPGFVLVLAGLYKIGIQAPHWQRTVMALIGTASIPTIGALGRRVGGSTVGLLAAFLAAVYPNIWINDGMLMVETVFILVVALSLVFTYRLIDRPSWLDVLGLSLTTTIAASVRPEAAILFPTFIAPFLLTRRGLGWGRRLATLGVAAAVPVVLFAPWVVHNLLRFDKPVYMSTGAGQTLAVANCDLTYDGDMLGYYKTDCLRPPIVSPLPDDMDRSERDAVLMRDARRYMVEHAAQVPKVVAARIGRLWHLYRPGQSITLDGWVEGRTGGNPGTSFGIVREALWMYYVLTAAGIAGLVLLRRRRVPIFPLLVQPALATFAAATTIGITRYRAGAEISIVVAAAVALVTASQAIFPGEPQSAGAVDVPESDDPASTISVAAGSCDDEPGSSATDPWVT